MADRASAPEQAGESTEASANSAADTSRFGPAFGILSFLVALGLGFWIGYWIQNRDVDWKGYDDHGRYKVELRGDEPQVGPDDALVTIIEFTDYQCPFCKKAHGPLMDIVEDNDDVRLIIKHHPLPMHAQAIPAARAAWAAHQQGKFWPMHDHLFEVGGALDDIEAAAQKMGLDVDRFRQDMLSPAANDAVENDRFAASIMGIGSTPHFVVNGRHLRGALSDAHWERVVDFERDDVEDIMDEHGIAPGGLYDHLMSNARSKRTAPRASGPDASKHHPVVGGPGRPSLGPDDALITVVEFSDFQCPYCTKLAPIMRALPSAHDDVRVVFRQLPLPGHEQARPAAKAALAAHRQGKFWEMHDALFAADGALGDAELTAIAESVGLDMARFREDLADAALDAMIDEDMAYAKKLGVGGTPASFVNGRFMSGAQPAERFDTLIEQERAAAQALLDNGTPREQILQTLVRNDEEGPAQ